MSPELIALVKSKDPVIQLTGAVKDEFAAACEQMWDKQTGDTMRAASVITGVKGATGMRSWYLGEYAS